MAVSRMSQQKKDRFLEAYAETGTVTHAATRAGIDRRTHYRWLQDDENYAEAFASAEQSVVDMLEGEAIRRATEGSDTLLIFLLKGLRPERYKERAHVTSEVRNTLDAGQLVDQAKAKVLQYLPGGLSA